jgi:hypothetical protein
MNTTFARTHFAIFGIVSLALFLLQGCAVPSRRDAVPAALQGKAEISGLHGVRYIPVVPEDVKAMAQEGVAAFLRERAYLQSHGQQGQMPPAVYLAISGGGDNGAFGAGLLNGWTVSGTRPTFKLVTGVSTGALIAPFAFLGPAYDGKLREVYTQVSPRDILEMRSLLAAIFGDALADNKPLWRLLEKYVDQRMLDAIAAEYTKGRLLLIATTNLDSRLPVVWNLTKIAASGHPRALELFRTLMIASAAIPGAFPPVLIDVVADGRSYQEMHVDGGATAQVFVYPPSLHVKELLREHHVQRERKLYIIRNARLDPEWAQVERRTLPIAQRAISSLIQSQGVGDLYRIYLTAQQDQMDYNLAYIPKSFQAPHREDFDTTYMRALFDFGYRLAQKGYPWQKAPSGVQPSSP